MHPKRSDASGHVRPAIPGVYTKWDSVSHMSLHVDIAVSWASIGEWSRAVQHCLDGLTGWLLVTPMLAELVVCLSHRYCGKASSPFREVLMNLRVLILIIPACVLVSALRQIYGRAFE